MLLKYFPVRFPTIKSQVRKQSDNTLVAHS
uniref:Uncharacterized protein n=1 Tax=Anguilla anguilla TaxID=7936 RepID=A0A0E9PSH4_ANGAN